MARQWVDHVTAEPSTLRKPGTVRETTKRRAARDLTVGTAADLLEELEPGGAVFGITKGQVSMIDFVMALIARCAPADVVLWTWCIADYEVEALHELVANEEIGGFRLVIDASGARMNRPIVADIQRRYGDDCVRVGKCHAKVARVSGRGLRFAARGSMNLNRNPRMEQIDISEGDAAADLIDQVVDEMWDRVGPLPVARLTAEAAVDLFAATGKRPAVPPWLEGIPEFVLAER